MLFLILAVQVFAAESTYTDLSQCKVFAEEEGQYERSTCGRVGPFELIKEWDDEREDITLKRGQRETTLGMGDGGFNQLGPRVEWRLQNGKAYALIARLIYRNDNKLYVARLPNKGEPCVIGQVDGKLPDANERARDLADDSRRTCR